jgi:hypothetical protein
MKSLHRALDLFTFQKMCPVIELIAMVTGGYGTYYQRLRRVRNGCLRAISQAWQKES